MTKAIYQVGEGANLEALPYGTKVGGQVALTEAEAMYERDLGHLVLVKAEQDEALIPGETKGHPADAETGEAIDLSDEERALIQAAPDLGSADGTMAEGQAHAEGSLLLADETDAFPGTAEADPVALKPRRNR